MRASQQFITRPAQELPGTERDAAESQVFGDYMALRRMVGWIGTLLPVAAVVTAVSVPLAGTSRRRRCLGPGTRQQAATWRTGMVSQRRRRQRRRRQAGGS